MEAPPRSPVTPGGRHGHPCAGHRVFPPLRKRQNGEGDHHHDTDDAQGNPTLDRCRFLAQNAQRRQSIAKQVPNPASLTIEQDREEHREAYDQRGGERAPQTHHAILPQPPLPSRVFFSARRAERDVDVALSACGIAEACCRWLEPDRQVPTRRISG